MQKCQPCYSVVSLDLLCLITGQDVELTFHDGTVRDLVFMQDISNRASLLISGGAGDSKIYVTDCESAMPIRAMAGHSGILMHFFSYSKIAKHQLAM